MKLLLSLIVSLSFSFNAMAGNQCHDKLTAIGNKANGIAVRLAAGNAHCLAAIKQGQSSSEGGQCPAAVWKSIEDAIKAAHIARDASKTCNDFCADTADQLNACLGIINKDNILNSGSDSISNQILKVNYIVAPNQSTQNNAPIAI